MQRTIFHYILAATDPITLGVRIRSVTTLTIALLGVLSLISVSRGAEIERELLRRAPQVLEHCRSRGYRNVGVLKFRVKKGNGPVSDSVGTFNSFLAERLEAALILTNKSAGGSPLGIIRNASAVAAKTAGANHNSEEGRKTLLAAKYPLAWGNPPLLVSPDALITGVVVVSPDLRDMQVGLMAFDAKMGALERIIPVFTAEVGIDALAELGESFALRGAFDEGSPRMTEKQVVETALKVKTAEVSNPLQDPKAPVLLEAAYNGRTMPIAFRGGEAFLADPKEGEQVTLTIRRNPAVPEERLAVVLKVNGENTLYRERKRDLDCSKWILELGKPAMVIRGYQKTSQTYEVFRALSIAESRKREFHYGADVGMISITVFREADPDDLPPAELPSEEDEDLLAMMRGGFPAQPPESLGALKAQLRTAARDEGTRGLIAEGAETKGAVRGVEFKIDPTPVMTAAIRYYLPSEN